jgi:hypothetical protein
MSIDDPASTRRNKRLMLAFRGIAILVLAAGTALCSLHHVWYGAALFLIAMTVNIFVTYSTLKRVKVLEQVSAARRKAT